MALKSVERRVDELELNKQDTLVSGVTIKTINGNSVLGSGNLTVGGSVAWGSITGTLSDQTDLQNALNAKQNTLISGTNIKTINGNTLLGSGDLTISTGITVGTTPVTSGTDGRVFFQSGGVVQQDSNFFWDNTNKRLGIGTNVPLSPLELYGNSTGVTTPLQIRNTFSGGNAIAAIKFTNTASTAFNSQNWAWIGSKRDVSISKARLVFAASDNIVNNPSTADIGMVLGFDKSLLIGTDGIAGARLDVRAQGALSTDMVQRWRNSANTADIGSIRGNGIWCIGLLASAPTGVEGAIYYDSTTKKHYGFDGTNWNALY